MAVADMAASATPLVASDRRVLIVANLDSESTHSIPYSEPSQATLEEQRAVLRRGPGGPFELWI
jgi:hypothetical protein